MLKKNTQNNMLAFSIIEVLISILVFSLGLSAIYLIIISTLKVNDYNKDYIIASNLAREQIDLLRNLRDSNYNSIYRWNHIPDNPETFSNFFTGGYYKIENNFSSSAFYPIRLESLIAFGEGKSVLNTKMQNYKLCLDSTNTYTYDCSGINKKTKFFKFLEIKPLIFNSGGINIVIKDAFKVKSKVIWTHRGYNETEINTVIADWKRL